MVRNSIIGALLLFITPCIQAQNGEYVFSFLNLPISTLAAGLGGNNVSSPERDLNLVFNNPALLDVDLNNAVEVGYMNYVSDIQLGSLAFARQINQRSSWMAGIRYMNYGRMLWTSSEGEILGETYAGDLALTGGYGFRLSERWRAGAAIHLIYSVLDAYTSFGITSDLGLYYENPSTYTSFGFVLKSLGAQLSAFNETYEPLPWDIQLGISKKLAHAPFRFTTTVQCLSNPNVSYTNDENNQVTVVSDKLSDKIFKHFLLGVEFIPSNNFLLSLGYNYRRKTELGIDQRTFFTGFTAGFGLRFKSTRIGASIARYHLAGSSLQLTYAMDLSKYGL